MTKLLCNFIVLPSILLAFGAVAGIYADRAFFRKDKIVIKEIEKPIVKYIKKVEPDDIESLWLCYDSPIKLKYKMIDPDIMRVVAMDTCKRTQQDIRIEAFDSGGWKTYAAIGGGALLIGAGSVFLFHR